MVAETRAQQYLNESEAAQLVKERLPQWIAESPELRKQMIDALDAASEPLLSYQDFLKLEDEAHTEWVNGVVIEMSPPSRRHQEIVGFLFQLMQTYAQEHGLGAVLPAPFQMKLEHGREPDLLFVATEHLDRLTETYLDGPADITVEVVLPESVARDRGEKFSEYAEGGVPEYWLIDPRTKWAEFYRLDQGFYQPVFAGTEGHFQSQALAGFRLDVAWLWPEPLPGILDTLRTLGLID